MGEITPERLHDDVDARLTALNKHDFGFIDGEPVLLDFTSAWTGPLEFSVVVTTDLPTDEPSQRTVFETDSLDALDEWVRDMEDADNLADLQERLDESADNHGRIELAGHGNFHRGRRVLGLV